MKLALLIVLLLAPKVARIDPPRRFLFLGNSFTYYNDGVPSHLKRLAIAADKANESDYEFRMATISGAHLSELAPVLPAAIHGEKWDVVVLQGQSAESFDPHKEEFRAAVRAIVPKAGAPAALFMTWAPRYKPELTQSIAQSYLAAGDEVNALVVPVGLAFERMRRQDPSIELHGPDGLHPSLEGTYLAACVFYSAFYRRSPEYNPYDAGLKADVAHKLQRAAWETTKEFYSKP